jgi:hypothetical protein
VSDLHPRGGVGHVAVRRCTLLLVILDRTLTLDQSERYLVIWAVRDVGTARRHPVTARGMAYA